MLTALIDYESGNLHSAEKAFQKVAAEVGAGEVTAIVARDTTVGLQFHPEKSSAAGLQMIANFLTWAP